MEGMQTEVLKTSGVVEAVAPHDGGRYSVKVGGEWYGGVGTCPAEKGNVYVIEYVLNGRFRNIKKIREIGEAVADALAEPSCARPAEPKPTRAVPVGVRNYASASGWRQTAITAEDEELIQQELRRHNYRIARESLEDARQLWAEAGVVDGATPKTVLGLALHLSEKRTLHISRLFEEFLTAKIAAERNGMEAGSRLEEAEDSPLPLQ